MLRILYAPHQGRKRERLARLLTELSLKKERALIIVPEQQVLETEGFLASLEGITPYLFEAASFRRVANGIFRRYGGLRYRYIGKGAKQVLMWRTLLSLRSEMKTMSGVTAEDMSKPRQLLDTVEELKHFGYSAGALEEVADKTDDSHLADKLRDLSLLYSTYDTLLREEKHDDAADDLARATALVKDTDYFGNTHVIVDSFDGFTVYELDLVSLMLRDSLSLTVTLAYEKDDSRKIFLKLKETDRRLRELAKRSSVEVTEEGLEGAYENDAVNYFSKNIFRSKKESRPEELRAENGYRFLRCAGLYEEAAFVAADIAKKVQAGARYRDFTVIARDVSRYQGILDVAFAGAGIPYFLSARKDAMAIPLVRLLFTALDIHCFGWRTEDVIAYMRSGLSGLTLEECDALEEYATVWNIRGKLWYSDEPWQMNPDGFTLTYNEKTGERLACLNGLRDRLIRPLTAFFESFAHESTVRGVSEALVHFLRAVGISRLLTEESERAMTMFASSEDREEHILFYNQLIGLLDELVKVAGSMTVTAREYSRLLYTLLAEADIGKLPARIDQVTVGNANLIRKSHSRYVYVMGLCQGVFPQPSGGNGCFDSEEKEKLAELGIETSPDGLRRLADEKLYYYRALTLASEMTTLTYTFRSDDGKESFPSSVLTDTCALWDMETKNIPLYSALPVEDRLYGASEIMEYAVKQGYTLAGYGEAERGYAVTQPLAASEDSLPEDLARAITDKEMHLTQSKADKFVRCPFSYHCTYNLRIAEPKNGSMKSVDVGSYIHKVLERFARGVKEKNKSLKTISYEDAYVILDGILEEYVAEIFRGRENKRMSYLLKRLRGLSRIMVKNILDECRVSSFEPRFFELSIDGGKSGEDKVAAYEKGGDADPCVRSKVHDLGKGKSLVLRGEVDRVDVYEKDGKSYIRVVDYKSGSKLFSMKDVEEGLHLQMLLYLFALCEDTSGDFRKLLHTKEAPVTAGVMYLSLTAKTASETVKPADEEASVTKMTEKLARSGVFLGEEEILSAMEKGLRGKFISVTVTPEDTKKKKAGGLKATSGTSLLSLEEMGKLSRQVEDTLIGIAKEINTGKGHAKPKGGKYDSPCRYCKMKPICRTPECFGNASDEDEKGDEA